MFGDLIAAYLFLAGAGAGGIAAGCVADLALGRGAGHGASDAAAATRPAARLVAFALAAGVAALALGTACLMADLGRLDRVLALFFAPTFTLMNLGAWALAALLPVGALLALARFMAFPWLGRRAIVVFEVVAVVLAAVVALYAGLLLQGLAGVRLWSFWWVPALFVLSAASCGCALLLGAAAFVEDDGAVRSVVRSALAADAVVVLAEAGCAGFFLGAVTGSPHPGLQASAAALLQGSAAVPWWLGFGLCGLVLPLAAEVTLAVRNRRRVVLARGPYAPGPVALATLCALVLVGAAGLRWAVVDAGEHRPLELQDPVAVAAPMGNQEAAPTTTAIFAATFHRAPTATSHPLPVGATSWSPLPQSASSLPSPIRLFRK